MVDYTDIATVKGAVGKTLTTKDADIARAITAISRAIDRYKNRADGGFVADAVATARLFPGSGGSVLRIDEAAAITGVGVKTASTGTTYDAWTVDQWIPFSGDPLNPDFNRTPYTGIMAAAGTGLRFTSGWGSDERSWPSGRRGGLSSGGRSGAAPPTVQVTAKWGYALTVPPQIQEACITEVARLVKQAESNYADGVLNETLGKLILVADLHPSTKLFLDKGRFTRVSVG